MNPAAHIGSTSTHSGGNVITGAVKTFVNDFPLAFVGSLLSPHTVGTDDHNSEVVIEGSLKTYVEDFPMARGLGDLPGDLCSEGARLVSGSANTIEG